MSTSSADLYVGKQCATRYRVVINGLGRSITTDVLERRQIFVTNFGLKVGTANSYSDGVNIDTNMVSSPGSRRETPKLTFGRVGCDRKKKRGEIKILSSSSTSSWNENRADRQSHKQPTRPLPVSFDFWPLRYDVAALRKHRPTDAATAVSGRKFHGQQRKSNGRLVSLKRDRIGMESKWQSIMTGRRYNITFIGRWRPSVSTSLERDGYDR